MFRDQSNVLKSHGPGFQNPKRLDGDYDDDIL